MRLDEERLEALRSWGEKLGQASGEEHAAIGRAILMLVEEIDRLHIELWHARMLPDATEPATTIEAAEEQLEEPVPSSPEAEPVGTSLHTQLKRLLRPRDVVSPVGKPPQAREDASPSGQDWIDALRRQK